MKKRQNKKKKLQRKWNLDLSHDYLLLPDHWTMLPLDYEQQKINRHKAFFSSIHAV